MNFKRLFVFIFGHTLSILGGDEIILIFSLKVGAVLNFVILRRYLNSSKVKRKRIVVFFHNKQSANLPYTNLETLLNKFFFSFHVNKPSENCMALAISVFQLTAWKNDQTAQSRYKFKQYRGIASSNFFDILTGEIAIISHINILPTFMGHKSQLLIDLSSKQWCATYLYFSHLIKFILNAGSSD